MCKVKKWERKKDMTTRRIVVLKLLRDSDNPMRRAELHRIANYNEDFRKVSGEPFWIEDFSWFMKDLLADGQVTQIKERNKVWYVITVTGLIYLLKVSEPKALRTMTLRRLRYYVRKNVQHLGWKSIGDDEIEKKIAELASLIIEGDEYVRQRYYKELVRDAAKRREWGERESNKELIEFVKQKGSWTSDADFALDVETLVQRQRRRLQELYEGYDTCFKCGNLIHRKEVVKVANDLAERLGIETGTVCCGCYDKLMGGEGKVAEINA